MKRLALAAWVFLLFPSPLKAFELFAFQVNGLGVFQKGGESFTGQAAWVPELSLDDDWTLRGELGITLLKSANTSRFVATNCEIFLSYAVVPTLALELGGGLSSWHGNGGSHPIASMYIVGFLPGPIERLFVAYSRYFVKDDAANGLKLGIGLYF